MKHLAKSLFTILLFGTYAASLKAETPQLNYLRYCQGCHGDAGQGSARNSVPELKEAITKFLVHPEGRDYLVQVADVSQSPIVDQELADLLNWMIRRFGTKEIQEKFAPYKASEISEPRLNRPANTRELRKKLTGKSIHSTMSD